ncbi:hypothetical protein PHLCEN_2v4652 [Hermanssonia centrifuga]|uniref:F-box domain-containing protein n=1 Tax=Hermanssonia centrifuga TaxID=98765 RepID=A0A2R6PN51_9APHY|nr:hypothetical protein PHLCEN_2v4652 [Hermanssonia centrifuga]
MNEFESLPVELIAEILGELDITSLITVSYLSRRLHTIASDPSLNPWRRPILRNLRGHPDASYEPCLKHLSVRRNVPRHNWVEIISLARAEWLLYEATLPNLKESEWEEGFNRRFLPGWRKWKKELGTWKEAFIKCLVVELADVRIIALGVLNKPRGSTTLNYNARIFLHPPGVEKTETAETPPENNTSAGPSTVGDDSTHRSRRPADINQVYRNMMHPTPARSHDNYPFYTPGGEDRRWIGSGEFEEGGMQWVGGLMLTAQIIGPHTKEAFTDGPRLQDWDLVTGSNRGQYASLTWADLSAIAPWLDVTKIDGPGLGID